MNPINIILIIIGVYILYKLFQWFSGKQTRYIPKHVKDNVLRRYYGMCAVCPENNIKVMEFHQSSCVNHEVSTKW